MQHINPQTPVKDATLPRSGTCNTPVVVRRCEALQFFEMDESSAANLAKGNLFALNEVVE
jgi:hypothetical protein